MAIGWCRIVPFLARRALPEPLVPSYLYPPHQGWLVWGTVLAPDLATVCGRVCTCPPAFCDEVLELVLILYPPAVWTYASFFAPCGPVTTIVVTELIECQ